jgi:hypothetical protein
MTRHANPGAELIRHDTHTLARTPEPRTTTTPTNRKRLAARSPAPRTHARSKIGFRTQPGRPDLVSARLPNHERRNDMR